MVARHSLIALPHLNRRGWHLLGQHHAVSSWGRGGAHSLSNHVQCVIYIYMSYIYTHTYMNDMLQQHAWIATQEGSTSAHSLSSVGICPRQHSRFSCHSQEGHVHSSFSFASLTKVCLLITKYTGGQKSSCIPWCMVLDPTTPTQALLFVDGCLISH